MANLTTNKDIDYIVKDFNSSVDALISFANVQYGPGTSANRLWTNFNIDSFSRNWLEILAFVADVFFFYFDNQATQSYLQTATIQSAVELIAKQFGFVPGTASSSSGVAQFTVTGAGTIPRGFKVQASNGSPFFVTNAVVAVAAGTVNANVLQGQIVSEQFVAQGLQNEEFGLKGPNVIMDLTNLNPADITPQITVNGNTYTLVDTLLKNNGTDQPAIEDSLGEVIGGGGRVFLLGTRSDDTPVVTFGDGIFGRKLQAGETVTVTYRTGGGTAGNIGKQTLNTLVDSLSFVTSVSNSADFSGGADAQTIEQLRDLIPASLRTLERAVTAQDYSDLLITNFTEVFAASTEANLTQPGIDLNVYVVPQGNGITNISDNVSLKNKLAAFLDRRKMVTTQFQILDAFGVDTLITLEVFISDTASKVSVTAAIQAAIAEFFDLSVGGVNQDGIGFAEHILLKDIDSLVAAIPGVERFEIKRLSYRPRIEANIVGIITTYANSDVTIFPTVTESEWLLAASGADSSAVNTLIIANTSLIDFNYDSGTGIIQYDFPINLLDVAPGDLFRDGANIDFTILAVSSKDNNVTITSGQSVNNTVSTSDHGSIRRGVFTTESYKVFKRTLAEATNLSIDTITDNNLDLSVATGTGTALTDRTLLDNNKIFIQGQYATGEYYLVDSAGNIWEILSNDSNTFTVDISAVNDAVVTSLSSGDYKIVQKLTGNQVVFQSNIFNIQFNSHNTIYSIGAEFELIGTIGDSFYISRLQNNRGVIGTALDLISYNPTTGIIRLNGNPSLAGMSAEYDILDSSGQLFNVVGIDNQAKPSVFYDLVNQDAEFVLKSTGLGVQVAQGFEVPDTDQYAVVSLYLRREGNITGNVTAKIVNDNGSGLPNLSSVVAVSQPKLVSAISDSGFSKAVFDFTAPPTLNASTQYHLVLSGDATYNSSQDSGSVAFDNTTFVGFTYNSLNGLVQYNSAVDLSNVVPGNYFRDSSLELFKVLTVDTVSFSLTLATGLTVDTTLPSASTQGAVIVNDRVLVGLDSSSPSYADGEFSRYDGALWSNSSSGPSPSGSAQAAIFWVEGTKAITIASNLTPVMGPGATTSLRYYDDNNEISLVLGISNGTPTSATDADALGKGTVAAIEDRPIDTFIFRTSRYADDIVNLRLNEIPQSQASDVDIQIFGGVD